MSLNLWTFLLQIVNFLVLATALNWLLYRPLRAAVDRRRQAIEKERFDAEQTRQAACRLQESLQAELAKVERERQETVHHAYEQARAESAKLLTEAERSIQQKHQQSEKALALERTQTLAAVHEEIVRQAIELSERILVAATNETLHIHLARHLLDDLERMSADEQAKLRTERRLEDGVLLETAASLGEPLLVEFRRQIQTLTGEGMLQVAVQPALLGGARLRVGGRIWDSSLAGQLEPDAHG